ncbi:MAG: alpha/beta hydrolase family protein, partial [Actinomycetota bacterium]
MLSVILLAVAPARAANPTTENGIMTSFDGTPIAYTFFAPGGSALHPVPVVLMTHGWAGSRSTSASGTVGWLLDHGYAVLTWDERGFGQSGGDAEVDSQQYEVRDTQGLIDMVAKRPEVKLDAAGDPRMGMLGGSYAGGIQLMTAAADTRVDAIVPQIAWNDLPRSLRPNGVFKFGWGSVLYGSGLATGAIEGLNSPA